MPLAGRLVLYTSTASGWRTKRMRLSNIIVLIVFSQIALLAQPIISNAAVDNITAHGARFGWTTNVGASDSRILVGVTDPPTRSIVADGTSSPTTHVWFASGLEADTLYYWRVCSTAGTEACTTSGTFTTLAAAPGIATPPNPPATFSTNYPVINGDSYNVAGDCHNLQSRIDLAASRDGSLNHEVVIPAGVVCVGRYDIPLKTGANPNGDGVVVIRGDAVMPPAGSRVTSDFANGYPTIISPYLLVFYQTTAPGTCETGSIWVDSDATSNWVHYCTSPNVYTAKTVDTGSGHPSHSCTADSWYRRTSVANLQEALWWCVTANTWVNVYVSGSNDFINFAALRSVNNVKGWRIAGVKIQALPEPSAYTDLLSRTSGSGDERGPRSFCLAYTQAGDNGVIFDRVWFEGQGFPHRQQEAICFADGTNIGVIDSYFNEINNWRPDNAGESTTHAIFFLNGPGPVIIRNNYFKNVGGFAVFVSDDNPLGQVNDVTIYRNDFFISPSMNQSEPTGSRRYYFRHHVELKRGGRWAIVGNVFNGGFPSANPNASAIGITPRNGTATSLQCRTNQVGVFDLDVRSNKFLYVPQFLLLTGHNDTKNCNTLTTIRSRFDNNVVFTTGRSSTGVTNGINGWQYNGQVSEIGLGFEDFIFSNNIIREPTSACCNANFTTFGGNWSAYPNSRFEFENNIYFGSNIGFQWSISVGGSGVYGTAALNDSIVPNSTYSYRGNGRQFGQTGGVPNNAAFPSGNYNSQLVSDFATSFYRCTVCGDEAAWRPLYNSKFSGSSSVARGVDGRSAGPDFGQFDIDQGILYNLRALSVTSSSATVYWTAPDATTACTLEYGTSSTPGTGVRVLDTPSSRFRSVSLSGLSPATLYYSRVYCGRMISSSFQTSP